MRHAGRPADGRSSSPLGSPGAAVLTPPDGLDLADPRFSSRLTPAFGIQAGRRRAGHDVPAFGTPEHAALLTGDLDLEAIERAAQGPLVGFAPIVLDPHGPRDEDRPAPGGPPTAATRALPSRRSLRAGSPSAGLGRPLADAVLGGQGLPSPRGLNGMAGVTSLPPMGASPATTGGLRVKDVEEALAARSRRPSGEESPLTGELARPFVDGRAAAPWNELEAVPPPVSVDVFQRAVRAGLAIDDTESLKALDERADAASRRSRTGRSRREVRARERAYTSTRSVTARRIAKGGVLAITALGVISSATPQGLDALGLGKDGATPRNTVDFAGALATDVSAPTLSPAQVDGVRRTVLADQLSSELAAAQAADVAHAGAVLGGAVAQIAQGRDAEVLAAREAARQRAVRDAIDDPQGVARLLAGDRGWGAGQFQCLVSLWNKESQWNYRAVNPSSNAYGIAQALPGSKMNSVGPDWRTNPVTQIKWGLNYIAERYGTPCGAWSHSQSTGWY